MRIPIAINNKKEIKYDIYIQSLPKLKFNTKVAIVTNPTVAGFHLKRVLDSIEAPLIKVVEVPDGEEYKNMDTVLSILDELFEAKFDRKSILIALGGGVIGDMTGFTASIYQRGIDFIQMPTTLLSQVDASVGGKTGVNNRFGKNLIGSFYQPKAVYIDPSFLDTLPKREYVAGAVEAIKMAVMFDRDFFEFLEQNDIFDRDISIKIIAKSVKLKADVVNMDEREKGVRAVLNYGHTFGHIIEKLTEYKRYLHGEAVAIGMVMANELAIKLNLLTKDEANRVKALLQKIGAPTYFKIEDVEEFYENFYLDKKSMGGEIAFILPNGRIGTHTIKRDIPKETIIEVLRRFKD